MADSASELARLKDLLLRPESSQLEHLQRRVGALDERLGTKDRLEQATAEVLVNAFRDAELRQHHELARAVAPVVVAAIQSEIRNSRDMMVEALYPITGRLVAAAVADAFRSLVASINERVDTMMSLRLWALRFKSWRTGKPLSELLLVQAARPRLHRVLLLERGSGTLLAQWSDDPAAEDRADLVSGMIAAITEFSSSVFEGRSGALRTIDMGASRILLHTSARAIVAGEFSGPLGPQDETLVHEAFARIAEHQHNGGTIEPAMLQAVADAISELPPEKKKRSSLGIWLVLALLAIIAGYFGWRTWSRTTFEHSVRTALATAVAARPATSAYPLNLRIDHGERSVWLAGLAPGEDDAAAMRAAVGAAAAPYRLQADLAIVASDASVARNSAQLRMLLNDLQKQIESLSQSGAEESRRLLSAQLAADLKIRGKIEDLLQVLQRQDASAQDLAKRLAELSEGLNKQISDTQSQIASVREAVRPEPYAAAESFMRRNAIFFERDTVLRDESVARGAAARLADLLRAADMRVRLVGFSSESGSPALNRKLALERANVVAALLAEHGIGAGRVVIAIRPGGNSLDDAPDASGHANRRVQFEPLFESEKPTP